ncbi:MAG TPA: NAD(P)-binding domain-containing protein, partial [Edaphobacter sp.]|nr:NAD(P)-binding domain-containing protein [Edaphobacter sp.]
MAGIDRRTTRVGIIGLGYVGLPLTLLFSEERFRVTGFDIDTTKVASLNSGQSYIHRIEPDHIQAAQRSGFRATSEFSEITAMDAVLICVPTPLNEDHTPDMSYVVSTIEAIAPHLRAGQLVVLESTTYPGTTEEIIVETINRHGAGKGLKVLRNHPSATELDGVMVAFS